MSAKILEGKPVAEGIFKQLLLDVSLLGHVPKLVVILVGDDPASETYVRSKNNRCRDLGLQGETMRFPATVTEKELVETIGTLNKDKAVHGILVQMPLPSHINKHAVIDAVSPLKDVDGLHPENMGRLLQGRPRFPPCTPAGLLEILKYYQIPVAGKTVAVLGRSEIVGKPAAQIFLNADSTVLMCHSKTGDLKERTQSADIVIVAIGKPRLVGPEYFRSDATVIDVGIHRIEGKICGDVDFEKVVSKVAAITPVPGGVGVMTIAMLMQNLVRAATLQNQ